MGVDRDRDRDGGEPPRARREQLHKPLQTQVARACGFHVPASLLTNDPERARAFAGRYGLVVYKAASGTRTTTGMLDLADTSRLRRLGTCPTYLQQYIAGTNVRVHVMGMDVFAIEIISDAVHEW